MLISTRGLPPYRHELRWPARWAARGPCIKEEDNGYDDGTENRVSRTARTGPESSGRCCGQADKFAADRVHDHGGDPARPADHRRAQMVVRPLARLDR